MTAISRPRVLIVFGGRSSEHEISCSTAAGILTAIDRTKWDVIPLGITRDGQWVRVADDPSALEFKDGKGQSVTAGSTRVALTPGEGNLVELTYDGDPSDDTSRVVGVEDLGHVDIVFPLLHGPYGEDGTIQGLFEMADVRYVGCGVTSSAISMDKHLTKTVLAAAGIDVGRWVCITARQWESDPASCMDRIERLGFPVFVKPCRAGSSVGISRVTMSRRPARGHQGGCEPRPAHHRRGLHFRPRGRMRRPRLALRLAQRHCAPGRASSSPRARFYDYEHKYVDDVVGLSCPADVAPEYADRIRETAWRAFDALECEGLARVDFFLDEATDTVIINEVNTMPGFTPISMYPQMWAAAGLSYPELLTELLNEAAQRPLGLR